MEKTKVHRIRSISLNEEDEKSSFNNQGILPQMNVLKPTTEMINKDLYVQTNNLTSRNLFFTRQKSYEVLFWFILEKLP